MPFSSQEPQSVSPTADNNPSLLAKPELDNPMGLNSREQLEFENKAFLSWVNYHLHPIGVHIKDFTTDLQDGVNLILLLEQLSGVKFTRYVKNPRFAAHKMANISQALQFLASHFNVQVVGCNPRDIMDGHRSQCMGLIFLLINRCRALSLEHAAGASSSTADPEDRMSSPLAGVTISSMANSFKGPYWDRQGGTARSRLVRQSIALPAATTAAAAPLLPLATTTTTVTSSSEQVTSALAPGTTDIAMAETPRMRLKNSTVLMKRLLLAFEAAFLCMNHQELVKASRTLRVQLTKSVHKLDSLSRLQACIRTHMVKILPRSRAKRRREEIVREIAQTEHSYVNSLQVLVELYIGRLEALGENVLPAAKIRNIFSEIKVILSYNRVILDKIDRRMESWRSSGQCLGDIFLNLIDFLKVYTAYVNNYDVAMSTLQDVVATVPEVVEALNECRQDPRARGMELGSYLIMPIQRIPRYVMLLSDLFKNTPPEHQDYPKLNLARQKMEHVAAYVNQRKREAENRLGVGTVLKHLTGLEQAPKTYTLPHRRYVCQGILSEISSTLAPSIKSLRQRYVFLFNDLIFITKEATGVARTRTQLATLDMDSLRTSDIQFKVLRTITLHGLVINNLPDVNKITNRFEILNIPAIMQILPGIPPSAIASFCSRPAAGGGRAAPAGSGGATPVPDLPIATDAAVAPSSLLAPADAAAAPPSGAAAAGALPLPGAPPAPLSDGSAMPDLSSSGASASRVMLVAPTAKEKDEWIQQLDAMVMECLDTRRSRVELNSTQLMSITKLPKNDLSKPGTKPMPPTFASTLYKRTKSGEWRKRFFSLYGDILVYYQDVLASINRNTEPKGEIPVLTCSTTLTASDRPNALQITTKSRTIILAADTLHSRLQWVNCIRVAIAFRLAQIESSNALTAPAAADADAAADSTAAAVATGRTATAHRMSNATDGRSPMPAAADRATIPAAATTAAPLKFATRMWHQAQLRRSVGGVSTVDSPAAGGESSRDPPAATGDGRPPPSLVTVSVQTTYDLPSDSPEVQVVLRAAGLPPSSSGGGGSGGGGGGLRLMRWSSRTSNSTGASRVLRAGELYRMPEKSTDRRLVRCRLVLTPEVLLCYDVQKRKLRGTLDLSFLHTNTERPLLESIDGLGIYHVFGLIITGRIFTFGSESASHSALWLCAIQGAIVAVNTTGITPAATTPSVYLGGRGTGPTAVLAVADPVVPSSVSPEAGSAPGEPPSSVR